MAIIFLNHPVGKQVPLPGYNILNQQLLSLTAEAYRVPQMVVQDVYTLARQAQKEPELTWYIFGGDADNPWVELKPEILIHFLGLVFPGRDFNIRTSITETYEEAEGTLPPVEVTTKSATTSTPVSGINPVLVIGTGLISFILFKSVFRKGKKNA